MIVNTTKIEGVSLYLDKNYKNREGTLKNTLTTGKSSEKSSELTTGKSSEKLSELTTGKSSENAAA